jgi:uncharacterized protein (TIGR02271 family)
VSGTYDDNLRREHEGTDETTYTEETRYTEGTDQTSYADGGAETVRHEERLATGTEVHETGSVRVRKHVETHPVEYSVPRDTEHVDASERVAAGEGDSGEVEVLDDGSVSIPIFEEVLVVTKRLVVRERVIVRKHTVVDEHKLQTELRREHVTIDADDSVNLTDNRPSAHATADRDGDGDVDSNDVDRNDGDSTSAYGQHRTDREGTDRL